MSEPYYVEPASELKFDWVYRQFVRIQASMTSEDGVFLENSEGITTSDSPYTMATYTVVLFANPDAGNITVNLPPGLDRKLVRISNIKTGGAATVAVYPDGTDLIQASVGADPGAGPLNLSKGSSETLLFVAGYGWAII